jgi:hypothetical protein
MSSQNQPGALLYPAAFGIRPENVEVPHYDSRDPTIADANYPVGKEWINVGNRIWKLLSISTVNNITSANWIQISTVSSNFVQLDTISKTGVVTGSILPLAGIIRVQAVKTTQSAPDSDFLVEKDIPIPNQMNIELEVATAVASPGTIDSAGIVAPNSANFTVSANGLLSAIAATTGQIGVVTLATQAQHEFNTYGTNQVLQSQFIPAMMARPSAIGSTAPNTGAFTTLSSNNGQLFSRGVDQGVVTSSVQSSTAYSAVNTTYRAHMLAVVPGSINAGFGTGYEITGTDRAGAQIPYANYYGVVDIPTAGVASTYGQVNVTEAGLAATSVSFHGTRVELGLATSRYRIGPAGVDMMSGTGDPNGAVTAAKGSFYMRLDGSSASTRAYINTNGTTGWTNLVTAS